MVRVRFSPAPTGSLHIGGAAHRAVQLALRPPRRVRAGVFVLRIEDTDVARSREEWVVGIQDTLRWLGLDWDEGPSSRATRFDLLPRRRRPSARAGRRLRVLLHRGRGEGAQRRRGRRRAPARLRRPLPRPHRRRTRGHARGRGPAAHRSGSARPTTGVSSFTDLIRGEVNVEWSPIHDFVIVRSDGTPIFFLANAVDDIDMGITHVIRGEDLIDSTHRVLALRQRRRRRRAADPQFAHLPLIVDAESRAKLSKRHGAVALEDFVDRGLPPRSADQLPRAARLGTRRRRPRGPRRRRAGRRSSTSTG